MTDINYPQECLELFELDNGEEALNAINYLWLQGVKTINLVQEGQGDSGEEADITILYADNEHYKYNALIHNALTEWMWCVAEHLSPGYEINDGGRVYLTFIKNYDVIQVTAKCSYWERIESVDSTVTYSNYSN